MGCASSAVSHSPITPIDQGGREDFHRKYALGAKIGMGAHAQVYSAGTRLSPKKEAVAVKVCSLQRGRSSNSLDKNVCVAAYKEICLWSRASSHSNCVCLQEHFFDDHFCYMVMEKCSHDLISYIQSLHMVTETSLADVFSQMLQGIAHLHSANIVHRDVKPYNFLVSGKGVVKLADFGLAAFVPEGGKVMGVAGTAPYMCPEMLQYGESNLKADVWSFGVVAHLLLCGALPYTCIDGRSKSMKLAIANGRPVKCKSPWLTESATSFLDTVLERDPSSRPSAESLLSSQFLNSSSKATRASDTQFLRSSGDIEQNLRPVLVSAIQAGDFYPQDLNQLWPVDTLLTKLQNGLLERTCKVLSQHEIDAFTGATLEEVNAFFEDFVLLGSIDSKAQEARSLESSKSTACPSTSTIAFSVVSS